MLSKKHMHLSFKNPAMWRELDFKTSTNSQVTPHAAPGIRESSTLHRDMEGKALGGWPRSWCPSSPHGSPHHGGTSPGHCSSCWPVHLKPCLYSQLKGSTYSQQSSSCCSHANSFPCCKSFVAPLVSPFQCEGDNLPVPLPCWCPLDHRGRVCFRTGCWAVNCRAHTCVPHTLLNCKPASTDCRAAMIPWSCRVPAELYQWI